MIRLSTILVGCLVFLLLAIPTTTAHELEELEQNEDYKVAYQAFGKKQFAMTEKRIRSILSTNNFQSLEAKMILLFYLGQSVMNQGGYKEAIPILAEVVAVNEEYAKSGPDNNLGPAYATLAVCYLNTGQSQQAYEFFKKAAPLLTDAPQHAWPKMITTQYLPQLQQQMNLKDNYYYLLDPQDHHWPSNMNTISIYIVDGNHLKGWPPENNQIVIDALNDWNNALRDNSFPVTLQAVDTPSNAQVFVEWAWTLKKPDGKSPVGGLVHVEINGRRRYDKKTVVIALYDEFGNPTRPEKIKHVAVHELGHMLGIIGHSDSIEDVMSELGSTDKISNRDLNTLKLIYSKPPYFTYKK